MPVTGRNQSPSQHGRSRVSPKRRGDPIGKRCHRPSSAVGQPIGRSPLFRLLPDQPEKTRSRRANQRARCLCHTALGRFRAVAGENGRGLRLAPPEERSHWLAAMRRPEDAIQLSATDQSLKPRPRAAPAPVGARPLTFTTSGARMLSAARRAGLRGRLRGPRSHISLLPRVDFAWPWPESQALLWKSPYCFRALKHPRGHRFPALAKQAREYCSVL